MRTGIIITCLLYSVLTFAQEATQDYPEQTLDAKEIRSQLEFLASDALRGRRTNSPGNEAAAAFIAAHLKAYGFDTPEEQDHHYQDVPLILGNPPASSALEIDGQQLKINDEFLLLSGPIIDTKTKGVFAGHGWIDTDQNHNDYEGLDVKGKVVFVLAGPPGSKDPSAIFEAMGAKRKYAKENGAIALFELYQLPFPWAMFASYFGGESMRLEKENEETTSSIVYGWMNKTDQISFEAIQTAKKLDVSLSCSGSQKEKVSSSNVIGILEGSDSELKDEYILLTAHYDHVGVGEQGGQQYTEQDSIFNGARDNGIGVVALLAAARSFSEMRPKRSVIILAVTGEELGLLGSKYYADHPLVPLEKVIFNFNTDGAGYTDTSVVSVVGWGRTGTDEFVIAGSKAFGLEVIGNPVPEMQLFDRSDNVSFAKKGIPCLSFSPGFREFDEDLMKNYHQVSDDTTDLDWDYIKKYCQAFTHSARLIANAATQPKWVEGDKYESIR